MTRLVARIKILPVDIEVNLDILAISLKTAIPAWLELRSHFTEPIPFGLNSLIVDITLEDSEGQIDKLEDSIKSVDGVGEIEVTNVSRQSVRIK